MNQGTPASGGGGAGEGSDLDPDLDLDEEGANGNRLVGGIPLAVLDFVVRSIVDDVESVVIDVDERRGRVDLQVSVAQSDMGKVIGRRGHVVQAIRTLVRAAGAREGVEAYVEIVD
ncbi:MAG: KH domain-containing protein [Acidimicrobiales bacterium]